MDLMIYRNMDTSESEENLLSTGDVKVFKPKKIKFKRKICVYLSFRRDFINRRVK